KGKHRFEPLAAFDPQDADAVLGDIDVGADFVVEWVGFVGQRIDLERELDLAGVGGRVAGQRDFVALGHAENLVLDGDFLVVQQQPNFDARIFEARRVDGAFDVDLRLDGNGRRLGADLHELKVLLLAGRGGTAQAERLNRADAAKQSRL